MPRLLMPLIVAGKAWFAEDAPNWIFALKTSAAGLLALWISFRLDFAQPQWALLTVYMVARRESGKVMTKSFYRILGTMVGCGMSLLLAALFSQAAELFLLALALWIGLCIALAARYRNFQSYGFMLAGYTAAIVGFGAAAAPNHAFDIAQARVSEVVLGILCAGVVAEAFFPSHASTRSIPDALARFDRFTDFLAHAFSLDMDSHRMQKIQQGFLTDIVASESRRSVTFMESPDARVRDARLRWMNASFMKISSTFHSFIQAMRRLRAQASPEAIAIVTCHYQELIDCIHGSDGKLDRSAASVAARLADYRAGLPQHRAEADALLAALDDAAGRRDATAALGLYIRVIEELSDYVAAVVALTSDKPDEPTTIPAFSLHADSWIAALSGLRTVGVLFVLSAFWIASAWPGGNGAAILGAVFCTLFGSTPAPVVVVKRMGVGFVIGQIMAFVCLFVVLPPADGFGSMALGMLPFLVFAAWLIEHPRYTVVSSGVFLAMLMAIAPHNQMNYDIVSFLNDGIATFIGLGAAGVAFSAFPASATRLRARLLARLGRQAAEACLAPLRKSALRHHFESRTRDLLHQLSTPPANAEGNTGDTMAYTMSILEVGNLVIEMRRSLARMSQASALRQPMGTLLREIAALCEHPCDELRRPVIEALDRMGAALDKLIGLDDADARRRDDLQLGCHQIGAILRDDDWFRLVRGAGHQIIASMGVSHAA